MVFLGPRGGMKTVWILFVMTADGFWPIEAFMTRDECVAAQYEVVSKEGRNGKRYGASICRERPWTK